METINLVSIQTKDVIIYFTILFSSFSHLMYSLSFAGNFLNNTEFYSITGWL